MPSPSQEHENARNAIRVRQNGHEDSAREWEELGDAISANVEGPAIAVRIIPCRSEGCRAKGELDECFGWTP
jgi:hypothetical protein